MTSGLKLGNITRIAGAAALPAAMLILVALMVIPVSPLILDISFVANIMISLLVLMVAMKAQKPLDFSSFPTVLLFATLFRLGLNVASTRVVLGPRAPGQAAAGHVIEAFGQVLIGGDYVVGLFVFAILMIINMIVITKGAGRVSEVSARFTLDALPGKQMAIDADLNAGLITPDEAKARRIEVSHRSRFLWRDGRCVEVREGRRRRRPADPVRQHHRRPDPRPFSHGLTLGPKRRRPMCCWRSATHWSRRSRRCCCRSPPPRSSPASARQGQDLTGQIGSQFASHRTWTAVAASPFCSASCPACPQIIILPAAAIAGCMAWKMWQGRASCRPPAARRGPEPVDPSRIGWDGGHRQYAGDDRHRLWPGAAGRRTQGRRADGPDHRHSAPAVEGARLRRPAGKGAATICQHARQRLSHLVSPG
jgi:flagellar biosynthesis protein FlhA